MSGFYFGIDLGTSNSSIAYVADDPRQRTSQMLQVGVVEMPMGEAGEGSSRRLPSVAGIEFVNDAPKTLLGWGVLRMFRRRLHRRRAQPLLEARRTVFRSVKSDMGTNRVYAGARLPGLNSPVKVSAGIIRELLVQAKRHLGVDPRDARLVITVPASFSALARNDTLAAARAAGLDPSRVELLDEPVAALLDLLNDPKASAILDGGRFRTILVFDYGGGTCDLTLVKARFDSTQTTGLHVETLAISQYRQLGGDDVDRAIMEQVVWPQIPERDTFSADDKRRIADTLTWSVARELKEAMCREAERRLAEHEGDWAKIGRPRLEVSAQVEPLFDLPGGGHLPRGFRMSLTQFEEVMRPFVALPMRRFAAAESESRWSLFVPVLRTLEAANVGPDALDILVLHGGACRNPFVERALRRELANADRLFSATIVPTPDQLTSVAKGAALACYWRHVRGVDVVEPIMSEDLGVIALAPDETPVVLAKAGTRLPFPNRDGVYEAPHDFYVQKDGQSTLLVPFYTGTGFRVAGTVSARLPAAVAKGALVRIQLRVDADKRLHWWFSVDGGPAVAAEAIDDPWSAEHPTPEWQAVLAHRREMRDALERAAGARLPKELVEREAALLYRAERLEDAEVVIDEYLRDFGESADALNLKGLVLSQSGRWREAADVHGRAVAQAPEHAVLIGNYGIALAKSGKPQEGIAVMRRGLARNERLAYLYEWLGDIYRTLGEEQAAARELREAERHALRDTKEYPHWLSAWDMLARVRRKLGEYGAADEARDHANALDRDHRYGGDSSDMLGILWREELS